MFYKGIIFDLDNTIYSYDDCHSNGLSAVFYFLCHQINIYDQKILEEKYAIINKKIKYELYGTASSHNKTIYFKQLLEELRLPIFILIEIERIYWDTFLQSMNPYEGVCEFIQWNKQQGIKVGILTDYETSHTIKKIRQLNIDIDIVVTSEEVRIEKPSIKMFQTILNKMNLNPDQVIMIGDNYEKDIIGAKNANIYSFWLSPHNQEETSNTFDSYVKLHNHFINISDELNRFKNISKYAGERFDLVQTGGGNSSVKIDDWLIIKSSGINMTNINRNNGYVIIDNERMVKDIKMQTTKEVTQYNVYGNHRASIETYMHSILKKYTLHLHPIQVNRILIAKDAIKILCNLFPESLIIDYFTPGLKLCNEILSQYNNQNIIFLINHGIIITSDKYNEIYEILEYVTNTVEKYQCQSNTYKKYKFTNILSKYIREKFNEEHVSYLSQNKIITDYVCDKPRLFSEKITFPDAVIYCGIQPIFLTEIFEEEISNYFETYKELPRIMIFEKNVYINAISLQKCKEIEEVFCANLLLLDSEFEKTYLSDSEIHFLNNWDAEKYRQKL